MLCPLFWLDFLDTIPGNQLHSRNTQVDNRRENIYQGASSKLLLLYSLWLQICEGGLTWALLCSQGVHMRRFLAYTHQNCTSSEYVEPLSSLIAKTLSSNWNSHAGFAMLVKSSIFFKAASGLIWGIKLRRLLIIVKGLFCNHCSSRGSSILCILSSKTTLLAWESLVQADKHRCFPEIPKHSFMFKDSQHFSNQLC